MVLSQNGNGKLGVEVLTKRASGKFKRNPRDKYRTPKKAVLPLLCHLPPNTLLDEPCAGDGCLVGHLEEAGHTCMRNSDIDPDSFEIQEIDAFALTDCRGDYFITNPPWDRKILHPLIVHLSNVAPTWLLFDADWAHTKAAAEFMPRCAKIVSVGRVSWMENGTAGFDNTAWYLFGRPEIINGTTFYGR